MNIRTSTSHVIRNKTRDIADFLKSKARPELAALYNAGMEVQVNAAQDGGEEVERKATLSDGTKIRWKEYTKDNKTWKHFRIPRNAKIDPVNNDSLLRWRLDEHAEHIGMTGWDFANRCSRWFAYDVDSIAGHADAHEKKLTDVELDVVIQAVRKVPWVTIRRSKGGKGFHLYIFLEAPVPGVMNHTEHAALAKAVLTKLSGLIGFDLEKKIDVCGNNFWIWSRTMAGNGCELVHQGETLRLEDVPANWRESLTVKVKVKTRRPKPKQRLGRKEKKKEGNSEAKAGSPKKLRLQLDVVKFLKESESRFKQLGIEVGPAKSGTDKDGKPLWRWNFAPDPFDLEDPTSRAYIIQFEDGYAVARNNHNSCTWNIATLINMMLDDVEKKIQSLGTVTRSPGTEGREDEEIDLQTCRDWMVEVRRRIVKTPGIYIDRSPTGAGKSYAEMVTIKNEVDTSLTVVPTHANCTETQQDYRDHEIDATAFPKLDRSTCENFDEASKVQALGFSVPAVLCPGCPFREACGQKGYRAGCREAKKSPNPIVTTTRFGKNPKRVCRNAQYINIHENCIDAIRPHCTFYHTKDKGIKLDGVIRYAKARLDWIEKQGQQGYLPTVKPSTPVFA